MTTDLTRPSATFPAPWTTEQDTGAPYYQDRMHFPFPLTPLEQTAIAEVLNAGHRAAMRQFHGLIEGLESIYRNYYRFDRITMIMPPSEEEGRRIQAAAEANLRGEAGLLIERWYGEHLPAVQAHHRRLARMEVAGASAKDLIALIDETIAILLDLWTIHFRIVGPMGLAMQLFDELYADIFGGTEADAHALLAGTTSESVKAAFGLSDLAVLARELELEALFRDTPDEALLPALGETPKGREFLAMLTTYLEEYGLRQDLFQLIVPTWCEDPSVALASIRSYMQTGRDARAEHAAIARAADAALVTAREYLAAYPEAVRAQFEEMLQAGRQGTFLQEEHNFYLDQKSIALLRFFSLKLGQRLVELGLLPTPDDVFMVTVDEITDLLASADSVGLAARTAALVRQRREEFAIAKTLTPPPFIGTPPPDSPRAPGTPMERADMRFWGGPPQAAPAPGQLQGNAGSRGIASGPARVARTLEEARAIQPGEILVAITTMPPWTPFFGVAAAVVTETGGPLSHCAIVAREYGIPAVVGANGATSAIATGQRVTVDGGSGLVTIDG